MTARPRATHTLRDWAILAAFLAYATPFFWQLLTSLKPEAELMVLPPLLPTRLTWEHYRVVLNQSVMLRALVNSLGVGAITTALDRDVRTRAYIYNVILGEKAIDDRLRHFPTWISSRNLANETSDEAVQALVEAVTRRYDVCVRYYRVKKQLLRVDELHEWDRYAPIGEAGRDLTYHGLRRFVDGADAVQEVTMAKLATQRAAFDTADDCLQIHGGAGYMVEYDIERAARDARLGPIGGGTDEIMKEILGRSLGL